MESSERTPWSEAAARHLHSERAYRRMTQAHMIEESGIPRSTYLRLESGARVMDVSQMWRACRALKVTPAEFAAGVDARLARPLAEVTAEVGIEVPTRKSTSRPPAPDQ